MPGVLCDIEAFSLLSVTWIPIEYSVLTMNHDPTPPNQDVPRRIQLLQNGVFFSATMEGLEAALESYVTGIARFD
jgi:hypothetical protein